ncbi:hypothetical protein UFOVP777_2 [uncultured Caudovirales phage]|uniref:Uncharacterized protein n=1 Tax=uncultured Caudovirales phage TaxID=2100421 RepID=A0A6J5NR35_9CAUD|nr:hypothetical protein UFOVP777_2 [uncultured Caudovirales phage]
MSRPKKFANNLDTLIRAQPMPTEISDGQVRRMLMQVLLDAGCDPKDDKEFKRMKVQLEVMRLMHQMNHVADKDDELSTAIAGALSERSRKDS